MINKTGSRGIAITLLGKEEECTFFEQMVNRFVIIAEVLPNLDDIYNLWDMFDPSLSNKNTNFDSYQLLQRLKERKLEKNCLIDEWIDFKNKFELKECKHQIKIKLGSDPKMYLVESQ